MTYKLFLQILLIMAIITTACICIMKPQMHKSVLVYNSDYQLVPKQEVVTEQKTLPTMPTQPEQKIIEQKVIDTPETQTVNLEPKVIHIFREAAPSVKVETKTTPIQTKQTPQKTQVQTKTKIPTTTQKNDYNIDVKQIAQRTAQNTAIPKNTTSTQNTITTNPSTRIQYTPPVKTTTKTTNSTPQTKVLTAQEEEILWNKWRSNLQNQIMKDTRLPQIPTGTVFRFSFNVDKYGKVSNVQTWSDTAKYTPFAIQYIAPVIRSYQGRSILNFPTGSNRTSTQVTGGWKISTNSKFSTPQDYNDTERIIK